MSEPTDRPPLDNYAQMYAWSRMEDRKHEPRLSLGSRLWEVYCANCLVHADGYFGSMGNLPNIPPGICGWWKMELRDNLRGKLL